MKIIAIIGNRVEVKIFRSYVKSKSDDIRFMHVEETFQTMGLEFIGFIDLGGENIDKSADLIHAVKLRVR